MLPRHPGCVPARPRGANEMNTPAVAASVNTAVARRCGGRHSGVGETAHGMQLASAMDTPIRVAANWTKADIMLDINVDMLHAVTEIARSRTRLG